MKQSLQASSKLVQADDLSRVVTLTYTHTDILYSLQHTVYATHFLKQDFAIISTTDSCSDISQTPLPPHHSPAGFKFGGSFCLAWINYMQNINFVHSPNMDSHNNKVIQFVLVDSNSFIIKYYYNTINCLFLQSRSRDKLYRILHITVLHLHVYMCFYGYGKCISHTYSVIQINRLNGHIPFSYTTL